MEPSYLTVIFYTVHFPIIHFVGDRKRRVSYEFFPCGYKLVHFHVIIHTKKRLINKKRILL